MQFAFRQLGADDVESLQLLLGSVPRYSEQITGHPPGPADALSALIGRPESVAQQDKYGFGLWADGQLVAFADVLRGYPTAEIAYIGLLIVRGDRQRAGHGRRLHNELMQSLTGWGEVHTVRLGIVASNAADSEPFFAANGYTPTSVTKPYRYDKLVSTVTLWQRPVVQ